MYKKGLCITITITLKLETMNMKENTEDVLSQKIPNPLFIIIESDPDQDATEPSKKKPRTNSSSSRSRSYHFVINNPTTNDQRDIATLRKEPQHRYSIIGNEVSPAGTPHFQGYVYFSATKSFNQVQRIIPRAHVEVAKYDAYYNFKYCSKEGDYDQVGDRPLSQKEKGEKGKEVYHLAHDLAKQGRFEEIPEPLRTRFHGTYRNVAREHQIKPEAIPVLDNRWYYGDSGTGKSRLSREEFPDAYLKSTNKWWCGYDGQEVAIIDELSPCHDKLATHLKKWADHHPFQAENKGGSLCIRPHKIIVTSNYSIREIFPNPADYLPLERRFQSTYFTSKSAEDPAPPKIRYMSTGATLDDPIPDYSNTNKA